MREKVAEVRKLKDNEQYHLEHDPTAGSSSGLVVSQLPLLDEEGDHVLDAPQASGDAYATFEYGQNGLPTPTATEDVAGDEYDSGDAQADETVNHRSNAEEYGSMNDVFDDCSRSLSAVKASGSMQNQSECRTVLTETCSGGMPILKHACGDAHHVSLFTTCPSGTLPRASLESLVIQSHWSEPLCSYYDFVANRCSTHVVGTEYLTGDELDASKDSNNTVDTVWLNIWASRTSPHTKSRCCDRGILAVQKGDELSSTALALPHRLGVTITSQNLERILESYDISKA